MTFTDDVMRPYFEALEQCADIYQREDAHPERCVLEHSLQCFRKALRESYDIDLILAALLHDVGKAIDSPGHEKYSVQILGDSISPKTHWLIVNHMRVHHFMDGTMKRPGKVKELVGHPWFSDLVHLARIDRLGRNPHIQSEYNREDIVAALSRNVDERFRENNKR